MGQSPSVDAYLREIWRRKVRIVGFTFAVAVVTAIVSLLLPKTYEAAAQLIVLPPQYKPELASKTPEVKTCQSLLTGPKVILGLKQRLTEGRQVLHDLTAGEALDEAFIEGILSKTSYTVAIETGCTTNVARFVANLDAEGLTGLEDYELEDLQEMTFEDLAESLQAVVTEEKKTAIDVIFSPIIQLRARGRTGPQAAMLANAWADVFLEMYSNLVREGLVGSYHFLAAEAERLEEQRAEQQEKIRQARDAYNIDFLTARVEAATENHQDLETKLAGQRLDLESATSRVASLDAILDAIEDGGMWIGLTTASVATTPPGLSADGRAMRAAVLAATRRLRRARADLQAFQARHDLETLKMERDRALLDLVEFQSQRKRETVRVEQIGEALRAVTARLDSTSPTLTLRRQSTTGTHWVEVPNPAWQELQYERSEREAELAGALAATAKLEPYLDDLETTVSALSSRLNRLETENAQLQKNLEFAQTEHDGYREAYIELKRERYQTAQKIAPLRANVGQLEQTIQRLRARIDDTQSTLTAGQTVLALEEIEDQTLERYLTLTLENLQEARLAVAQQGLDVKVASEAIAPSRKIWPQRTLMVMVMTALGFFFALAFVCARVYLDATGLWSET